MTAVTKTKTILRCPRCKQNQKHPDCLYRVVLEIYAIKGSSNEKWASHTNTLEDLEYRLCGNCLDKVREFAGGSLK